MNCCTYFRTKLLPSGRTWLRSLPMHGGPMHGRRNELATSSYLKSVIPAWVAQKTVLLFDLI